ncbi:MAG: 3-hydroxyacyl-CoA dehydrogenase family protein [Tissierellia bacterium]|nr:3-hydroxyacyl-CoA dehydrogenase family protein [Tissierellia bacterium]
MQLEQIKKIGIAGAGTMGSGIAQIFARQGYKVVMTDINDSILEKSKKLVNIFNDSLIEEEIMSKDEIDVVIANISYSTDKAVFSDCDLIIEAIIEKMDIKQAFWKEVESIAREDAYFATNTSGLSINKIFDLVEKKERTIGMHFWNPPHIIPLVELIRGDKTSDSTVEVLKELLKTIGKEPVVVQKDAPGFIGNRLQFAAFREAMYIVDQGIATVEDVDKAMKFGPGFRYPVIGPLQTADLGGLDTFYYISSYLFNELSDAKEPPEMLRSRMESGKLGVKSKEGFYDYSDGKDELAIKTRDKMFFKMLKYIHMEQKGR